MVQRRALGTHTYLTAPRVNPRTRCRCTIRMKTKIGTIDVMPSAAR